MLRSRKLLKIFMPQRYFSTLKKELEHKFIGQDYYLNKFSTIVHQELFSNPRWYSAYTPYQAEISLGRLELAFYYQDYLKYTYFVLTTKCLNDE